MPTIDPPRDPRIDLSRAPDFRGSAHTVFVRDGLNDAWWICSWSGAEVELSRRELEEFVEHCLRHQAPGAATGGGD